MADYAKLQSSAARLFRHYSTDVVADTIKFEISFDYVSTSVDEIPFFVLISFFFILPQAVLDNQPEILEGGSCELKFVSIQSAFTPSYHEKILRFSPGKDC